MLDAVAPGARVVIRDAEWLVRKVDTTSTGGYAIHTVGMSELVKNREAIFLSELEHDITVMDPAETKLVPDTSPHFRNALLYVESLLRQTPPTDPPSEEKLYIGHQAAMDLVGYQLDPAIQALKQPRQRLLIADAVGLGKTLEAGILLAELIRRGRGKRLLVVTLKSMLTQFQKELWARFAIPLVRLDSVGIQRVRHQIPSHHNPFYYFDRAIISIDTLKQDSAYRPFIENCYWDIIVIDEAHNVAERGSSSLRAKLARLLASQSDTLIMLSATPHDGRKASFASLMNMLNPTAIANPDDYGPDDIKGLFIRRFKKDIQHQVQSAFMDRMILKAPCQASAAEEVVFDYFTGMTFGRLDQRTSGVRLFKTTLEKALFSSPAACIDTARNRVRTLEREYQETTDPVLQKAIRHDVDALDNLIASVQQINPTEFSKYQKLLCVIRDTTYGFGWTPTDPTDRLVIFTERIETLRFLQEHLQKDLKLRANQIGVLYGTLSDVDQQHMVEDFGKEASPVRILIASDIAAEGINLHYLSHRLIHFDIPWSLMVFQQRNGRIDRYGQTRQPQIVYLLTHTQSTKIRGDTRILTVGMIAGVRVGLVRRTRFGASCEEAVARGFADVPPAQGTRLLVVDAGMATKEQCAAAPEQDALLGRLRINAKLRCAPPPPTGHPGRRPVHGAVIHPGSAIPEVAPDVDRHIPGEAGLIRLRRWHRLHSAACPTLRLDVVRIDDPAYDKPLLVGTTASELTSEACRVAYGHRWPGETNFFVAQESTAMEMPRAWTATALERRISVAWLAGSQLKAIAAVCAPQAMGPWDRQPVRSAGRLANSLESHAWHCAALALQGVEPRNYRKKLNGLQRKELRRRKAA